MHRKPHFSLSMLDLVAVREGASVGQALATALATVQHAERLGFKRYWVAARVKLVVAQFTQLTAE